MTVRRWMYQLFQEAGYPNPAGQFWSPAIPGYGAGVWLTDYEITGWSLVSGGPSTYHAHNDVLSTVINIAGGNKASLVQRKGNVIDLNIPNGNPGGFNVLLSSNVQGMGNFTLSQTLVSPVNYRPSIIHEAPWFYGYTSPNVPPGSDEAEVQFRATKGQVGQSNGYVAVTWDIDYAPSVYAWHDPMTMQFGCNLLQRDDDSSVPWDWEWHRNSTFTDLVVAQNGTSVALLFDYTYPQGAAGPYYVRGRPSAGGAWRNDTLGRTFNDPRP